MLALQLGFRSLMYRGGQGQVFQTKGQAWVPSSGFAQQEVLIGECWPSHTCWRR